MKRIFFLQNPIMDYAWGSKTAIAELLGQPAPSKMPQAELWMGAHAKASSTVGMEGRQVPLSTLISEFPEPILGTETVRRYGGRLPFLFKVLAAAEPLSIQAHPNKEQARRGFDRENAAKIPLDAPHRNYKDDDHKPECICALSRFWGLNGFRRIDDMLEYFQRLGASCIEDELWLLEKGDLKGFFQAMMTMAPSRKQRVTAEVRDLASSEEADDPVFRWIGSLARAYPGDIGILAPVLLNLVCLEPGEAMFLASGELHAYLEGVGIELMANSDNVLRGGLTRKHVDLPELLDALTFAPRSVERLRSVPEKDSVRRYPCPAGEFALSVIDVSEKSPFQSGRQRSVEILLCTAGRLRLIEQGCPETSVKRGASFLVPAASPAYRLEGSGRLYRASVPL